SCFRSNRVNEHSQTVVVTICDMHQLMCKHTYHSFIRAEAGEKDRSKGDGVRPAQEYRRVVARFHVRLHGFDSIHTSNSLLDTYPENAITIETILLRELLQ